MDERYFVSLKFDTISSRPIVLARQSELNSAIGKNNRIIEKMVQTLVSIIHM